MDPEEFKYTKDHEWVQIDGKTATVGITEYAQKQLGAITYVELPQVGKEVDQFGELGVVESVKTASDFSAPLSGKVVEVNDALEDHPESINEDACGEGWICKVAVANVKEAKALLSHTQYQKLVEEEGK